ncbi:MAG: ABC transporter permease [Melioribacteraceae bacterium]|nr:ABC transporter permease [Melioribacteraceae bacterium]
MLLKLAWRNIWRNKRRSLIVVLSVLVGVNAILLIDALMNGMLYQILFNQISLSVSHVQVHKSGFNNNKVVQNYIENPGEVEYALNNNKLVKSYSKRVITFGLLSSASNSTGVYIYGVDPGIEDKISIIKESVIEGSYLSDTNRDIVIGQKLAEKLKVGIGDKVVAMASRPDGSIGSDVFRIAGIFKTPSSEFDKLNIFITLTSSQQLLNIPGKVHEFAVITNDYELSNNLRNELKSTLTEDYEIQSYEDLLPFVIIQLDIYKESLFVINLIIGLALIFGIINSMLMSVFERINEFGVLMSIGMKNNKIFLMVLMEAFVIGTAGTIFGVISGYLINIPLSINGIDLSFFSESLESLALGSVLYPQLSLANFVMTLLLIPFISVAGAFYPAFKAIKLDPVNAIRYVR